MSSLGKCSDEEKERLAIAATRMAAACNSSNKRSEERQTERASCQRCETVGRIYHVSAHGKDLCDAEFNDTKHEGYLPYVDNLGGGDDLAIAVCLECGQIQGKFTVEDTCFDEDED